MLFETNYRGISLLSLLGKVHAKCRKRKCREIVESKLEDGQCGFRAGRSTMDQIFTLKQIFEKSWENGKDLFACFVDLEEAYMTGSRLFDHFVANLFVATYFVASRFRHRLFRRQFSAL